MNVDSAGRDAAMWALRGPIGIAVYSYVERGDIDLAKFGSDAFGNAMADLTQAWTNGATDEEIVEAVRRVLALHPDPTTVIKQYHDRAVGHEHCDLPACTCRFERFGRNEVVLAGLLELLRSTISWIDVASVRFVWCFDHGRLHVFSSEAWCTAWWVELNGTDETEAMADKRERFGDVVFYDKLPFETQIALSQQRRPS